MPASRFAAVAVFVLVCSAAAARCEEVVRVLAAAQERLQAGDFDGALQALEPMLASDQLDRPSHRQARELGARILHARGETHFRQARIAESLADFDRELLLEPDRAAEHWQRGIACYYAGKFEEGVRQFELHQTVNSQDVENAAWHFLCIVRSPEGTVEAARASLIPVTDDPRAPMAEIQQMFAGTVTPEEVLRAGEAAGGGARFYADLYVGLYHEALGHDGESLRLVRAAADNPAARDSFMGAAARVHVALRTKATPAPEAQEPQGGK